MQPLDNTTSGTVSRPPAAKVWRPSLVEDRVIAYDPTGNLRDPSSAVQDVNGTWHFWVDYMPGSTTPGWGAYQHHYTADDIRVGQVASRACSPPKRAPPERARARCVVFGAVSPNLQSLFFCLRCQP